MTTPPLPKIYIASKTRHVQRWLSLRRELEGRAIITSTWIDEAGQGATADWSDLWRRCVQEAATSDATILYAEQGEVLKGALVEMGAALAHSHRVFFVGPLDLLTATHHPFVEHAPSVEAAVARILTPAAARNELLAIVQGAMDVDDDAAVDAAIDTVFESIDDAFCAGRFEDVDYVLEHAWPKVTGVAQALGLLTITLAARDHLPMRPVFYRRLDAFLRQWQEDDREGLLAGLE